MAKGKIEITEPTNQKSKPSKIGFKEFGSINVGGTEMGKHEKYESGPPSSMPGGTYQNFKSNRSPMDDVDEEVLDNMFDGELADGTGSSKGLPTDAPMSIVPVGGHPMPKTNKEQPAEMFKDGGGSWFKGGEKGK